MRNVWIVSLFITATGAPWAENGMTAAMQTDKSPGIPEAVLPKSAAEGKELTNPSRTGVIAVFHESVQGEIDGLLLEDGLEVQFPAKWGSAITQATEAGQTVVLTGIIRKALKGGEILILASLTNPVTGVVVRIPSDTKQSLPVTNTKAPPGQSKPAAEPTEIRGKVTGFRQNKDGRTDQLVVDDKTVVRIPPHMSEQIIAVVKAGSDLQITGTMHTGPKGDTHLRAETLRIVATGETIDLTNKGGKRPGADGPDKKPKPVHELIVKEFRDLPKSLGEQFGIGNPPKGEKPVNDEFKGGKPGKDGKPPKAEKKPKS